MVIATRTHTVVAHSWKQSISVAVRAKSTILIQIQSILSEVQALKRTILLQTPNEVNSEKIEFFQKPKTCTLHEILILVLGSY